MSDTLRDETQLSHLGEDRQGAHGAVVPPIYQNSLFTFDSWEAIDEAFDNRTETPIYSRGVNPTVRIAEEKIAHLARGEKARLFGSGMAAIAAAVLSCVNQGDHVVAVKNIYGPANNLMTKYLRDKMGLELTFVEGSDPDEFERASRSNTRLYYLESPSSAVLTLQNIPAVTRIARTHGIKTIIDNTWATPLFQKPLTLGVDLEVHTCSKYLGGHSDLIAGVVIGSASDIQRMASTELELLGGICSPQIAWLITRSLRTLPIRMRAHQEGAIQVAQFLDAHKAIQKVYYPGLPTHSQFELARAQMSGSSGLLAFNLATENLDAIKGFFNSLNLFQIGVSWGGHESLIYAPAISYLKEFTKEQYANLGISLGLMRISVGLEHPDDLVADLKQSLDRWIP